MCREKKFNGSALIRKPKAKRGESENREANDADASKPVRKRFVKNAKRLALIAL